MIFFNFKILAISTVKSFNMCHCTKFRTVTDPIRQAIAEIMSIYGRRMEYGKPLYFFPVVSSSIYLLLFLYGRPMEYGRPYVIFSKGQESKNSSVGLPT